MGKKKIKKKGIGRGGEREATLWENRVHGKGPNRTSKLAAWGKKKDPQEKSGKKGKVRFPGKRVGEVSSGTWGGGGGGQGGAN